MSFRNVLVAADSGASPSKVDRAALDDIGQFNLESESQPGSQIREEQIKAKSGLQVYNDSHLIGNTQSIGNWTPSSSKSDGEPREQN